MPQYSATLSTVQAASLRASSAMINLLDSGSLAESDGTPIPSYAALLWGAGNTPVKGHVEQKRPTDMQEIRARLNQRLKAKNLTARQLAHRVKFPEKNVQRWINGKLEKIPADFIGACEAEGFASARWLLTGEGGAEVEETPDAEVRLQVIQMVSHDAIPVEALRDFAKTHRPAAPGASGARTARARRARGPRPDATRGKQGSDDQ